MSFFFLLAETGACNPKFIYNRAAEKEKTIAIISRSLDLNPTEVIGDGTKRELRTSCLNLNELKQCCKIEWVKIPPNSFERSIVKHKITSLTLPHSQLLKDYFRNISFIQ